jgi:5-methylcytosine-specific restriction endonuclease McrBC regulatory subunit McrC
MPWDFINKWISTNEEYLNFLGIKYSRDFDKGLILEATNKIGLAPVRNPYGRGVYGSIIVKPRIGWIKISEILDSIEWRYKPVFLTAEEPIMSEGVLPRWFKAIETLKAIERVFRCHFRGMEEIHEIRDNPVGRVNWNKYAATDVPFGKWNRFDCTITNYSLDLDIHRQFKGIVEQIERDLLGRSVPPNIVKKASISIQRIKKVLLNIKSETPDISKLKNSKIPSFYRSIYEDAKTRAIEYVSQSRFSIYSAEYFGLPWSIEMNRLFEFWVEFWSYKFSKQIGANFYSDIKGSSKIRFLPLGGWRGLRDLKPDIIIDNNETTMIIDVKYKKHLLYLKHGNFMGDIQEEHRRDVHQILAYVGSSSDPQKKAVLLYPQLLNEPIVEKAEIVNYRNSKINLTLFKIDTSFHSNELLDRLRIIWQN